MVIGPIGSGKTTFARNLFRCGALRGRRAFIFNDDGTPDTIDAGIIGDDADLQSMNAGCFGCRDVAEFKRAVLQVQTSGEYDYLMVEPLGFVEGTEIPRALGECGISPRVISLLDVQHLKENHQLGIVPSQLRAGSIICFTKYPCGLTSIDDPCLEEALEYVGRHAPGVPVTLLAKSEVNQEIIEAIMADRFSNHHHVHTPVCMQGHGHHHRHGGHDHGFFPYSMRLKCDVTLADVIRCVGAFGSTVVRGKGVVKQRQFHCVHGTWEETIYDGSRPFLTIYATAKLSLEPLSAIIEKDHAASGTTRSLLRSDTFSADETVSLIERILKNLPTEPTFGKDGPVTNPESHEMLNEIRKRPGVPHELNARAIRARVEYYLAVASILTPDSPWWHGPSSAKKKYDLAVGIGWFARHKPDALGPNVMDQVAKVDLCTLLAQGLSGFTGHNESTEVAIELALEVRDVIRFTNGGRDTNLRHAVEHCLQIARGRPELEQVWQEVLSEFKQ